MKKVVLFRKRRNNRTAIYGGDSSTDYSALNTISGGVSNTDYTALNIICGGDSSTSF